MANALRSQRGKKKTETLKTGPALINSSPREWKPLIEEKDYCKGKINIYSSFQVIDDIKEKLTQRQKHLFAQTCFGQFLQLKRIQFHGQLIHHILLRQLVCPAGENSMWFRIGGKEYEFGLKEFAVITGLNCSEFGSLEVENHLNNRIRDRYFDGKYSVIGKDLDLSFKNCNGNKDEDVIKLAQLYLLERFLFGKDSRRPTKKLPIGLVDKAEDFNKFPWGRLLYNCLKHSIKNLLRSRDKKISKTPTKDSNISYLTYELHGFPYVLQFWVYECIPLIGKKLAHRIDQKMPRMLNWATSKQPNSKSLENEVFNADELELKSGLQLTVDEINKEYLCNSSNKKRLKKKNEAASMEEEDLFVDKAQEIVSPGKSHEEYEGNGTEDDLSKEYSYKYSRRKKLKKKNTLLNKIQSSPREWKPLIEEKHYFRGKINLNSSFQVINYIKEKLTQRQKELFARTCFGQFLQLQQIQFPKQLIHYILLRQLVCPTGENSIWFRISGKEYEFGPKGFELITGLDCSEFGLLEVEDNLKDGIRDRYFDGKDRVTGKDLDLSFKNCNGDKDEDVVKLAQLYLLERFLLGKDCRRLTENFAIRLVDNAKDFNKFPWGRFLYERLIKSIKNLVTARKKKIRKMQKKDSNISRLSYELHGFPYVLQFWAYECIPLVRKYFACRIDRKMPKMLNWAMSLHPDLEFIKDEVFNADELQVSSELQLTEDEKNEEHSCNASNRKRLKKKNETARTEEDKLFVEKAQENVSKRKNHEENGMECETDEEVLCDNYRRKKLKKKNETASTEEDESFVKEAKDNFTKGKDHEEYGENGMEVEIIEEFCDYSVRNKLKKKNETTSTEEDESFVEKAEEKFTKGKYHEEHDENGMEDEMYVKFLCDYSRREQLEKKNETANAEEDKSSGEKAQEEVTKGKSQEESVDNGKIHMNEEENDSEKHYKDENMDTTLGNTSIKGGNWKSASPASVREEFLASMKNEFLASMGEEFLASMKKEFMDSMREEFLSSVRGEFRDSMREEVRKAVGEEISTSRATNSAMRAEMSVKMTGSKQQTNITDELRVVLSEAEDNYEDKCSVKRKRERNNPRSEGDIRCFSVHLFEPPPHDEKEEFDQWIKVGLKRNRRNKYSDTLNKLDPVFDFNIDTCKQKDWFFLLNETGQWLNSTHIDVALYFVRMKKKDHPDVFKPRCTTTDWLFPVILNARYPQFKKDPEKFSWDKEAFIQKTLKGIEPCHSLPWVDVDTIYIPLNIVRKHWVPLVLDLKRWTLYVYDSYRAAKHDKEVVLTCRPFAEMVPWILKSVGFFDARKDLKEATSPLDVELVDGIPQQDNGGDCGIFMLKFIEFMMQNTPLDTCTQGNMPFFRNKMAVELYAYGKKKMVKK